MAFTGNGGLLSPGRTECVLPCFWLVIYDKQQSNELLCDTPHWRAGSAWEFINLFKMQHIYLHAVCDAVREAGWLQLILMPKLTRQA